MKTLLFVVALWVALLHGPFVTAAVAETVFTGDTIGGIRVISQLDVSDLEPGAKHRFLFRGVEMGTGQHWYVPVMVAKGAQSGKKVVLAAGVHGDEVSPVAAIQKVFSELAPVRMQGTVVAVFDIARPAKEFTQRRWPTTADGGNLIDMNRVWPGKEFGNAAERQAWLVWNKLFKGNVDVVLDHHTAATGNDFSLFIFADRRNADVKALSDLFPYQHIKDDPGGDGVLESTFVRAGIPAMTLELGAPRKFDRSMIASTVEGVANVLAYLKVTDGNIGRTSKEAGTFFGNKLEAINARTGGWVELLVELGDKVQPNQKVAIQRNSFGDVVHEYTAGVEGEVAIVGRDALREPGNLIVEILTKSTEPDCADGGCHYQGDY